MDSDEEIDRILAQSDAEIVASLGGEEAAARVADEVRNVLWTAFFDALAERYPKTLQ